MAAVRSDAHVPLVNPIDSSPMERSTNPNPPIPTAATPITMSLIRQGATKLLFNERGTSRQRNKGSWNEMYHIMQI